MRLGMIRHSRLSMRERSSRGIGRGWVKSLQPDAPETAGEPLARARAANQIEIGEDGASAGLPGAHLNEVVLVATDDSSASAGPRDP